MLVRPAMKRLFCLKAKNGLGRFAPSALRFSGSSLILSCLTVSFSCGRVYSRVKRTPESEKKKTYVYLIKRIIKKKMLVYIPGTYISPFVLALEGGVNSNPFSWERLFLRTAHIPFCSNTRRRCELLTLPAERGYSWGRQIRGRIKTTTYMADTKRAAAHRRPGPERGAAAYRRTPEREQTIFYPNNL